MKVKEFVIEYKKDRKAPKFNIKPRTGHAPTQTGAGAHRDKKKEQKQGYEKHKGKGVAEGISYGTMSPDLARKLLSVYQEYSDSVEQYRDEDGANELYQNLVSVAKESNGAAYLKNLFNSASRSAHMDFDTNPGHFKNWFPYVGDALESLVDLMKKSGKIDDEPDTYIDKESFAMDERIRDPEDWDEGNTEPPNNFAVYINGKKWKVFKGKGQFADDYKERNHYRQLQNWAQAKSASTGKKWEVYVTGEQATEGIEEGWKSKVAGAALAGAAALGGGAAQASEPVGPMAVMATIKMQLPDGSVKTIKKDLGHSYDFRLDDAKKDLENLLDRKGIKKYTIHLDRYNSNDAAASAPEKTKDYMDKTPLAGKADGNKDYMDKGPYSAKQTKSTYLDKSTGKEFRDINNY